MGCWLRNYLGWRSTIGLIVLLGLVAVLGVVSRTEGFPTMPVIAWQERLRALADHFTVATLGVTFWVGVASLGLYTYLAEIASGRKMAAYTHGLIWLWGLGGMVGALLIGRVLAGYLSPKRATSFILVLLAVGFVLVGWGTLDAVGTGGFLWGLAGWASVVPQQHALLTHNRKHATATIAWNSSVNYLGGASGAALGSLFLDLRVPIYWLPAGALIGAAIALLLHLSKPKC